MDKNPLVWLAPSADGEGVIFWGWRNFDAENPTPPDVKRVMTWAELSQWAAKRAQPAQTPAPRPSVTPKVKPEPVQDETYTEALEALKALGYGTAESKKLLEGSTGSTAERVSYALQKA